MQNTAAETTAHLQQGLFHLQAQIHTQLVSGGLMSAYSSMKKRGLTDEQVEAELEQIRREQSEQKPIDLGVINYGGA